MTSSIYIVGGPGAGKSTLMARLLAPWSVGPCDRLTEKELFGHQLQRGLDVGVYLGRIREQFPGTDALSMSVSPVAAAWARTRAGHYDMILGEGGRLAVRPFLDALVDHTRMLLVHLAVDFEVARARSDARPDSNDWKPVHGKVRQGRGQADSWIKSGAAKAAKLAAEYPSVTINTSGMSPDQVEETLWMLF